MLALGGKVFADVYSSKQMIQAGHWVYDAMEKLALENARCSLIENAPLSVGELRIHFAKYDYEKLSASGKKLYEEVYNFLYKDAKKFKFSGAFMAFNVFAEPEFLFKSNDNLDWSYGTDYTGKVPHKYYKTEDGVIMESGFEESEYGPTSNYNASSLNKPLVTLPIYLGWGDIFMIETAPCFAKSFWGMTKDSNFINIPFSSSEIDFMQPRDAVACIGWEFNRWGFNFNVGRSGLQIGRSQTGSVIYNNSFESQFYFQMNFYCEFMKYNLDIIQVEKNNFMYLHQIVVSPWKWIKVGLVEGSLVQEPFELRFLNPLMIMHSFGGWEDYMTEAEDDHYGEAHFCAYLGVMVDIVPCKNWRIYALYGQNEIQAPYEAGSSSGDSIPDGFGWQVGVEANFHEKHGGFFTAGIEGVYTTPFLYSKQGSAWSMYSKRFDMQDNGNIPLCSWAGTPFGPDAIGFQAKLNYEYLQKWSATFQYLFVAHGTNSFGMYDSYFTDENGDVWSSFYPSAMRHSGLIGDDEAKDIAHTHKLTGTIQYTNNITLKGHYRINKHFNIEALFSYIFVFNNKNVSDKFENGVELAASMTYQLW